MHKHKKSWTNSLRFILLGLAYCKTFIEGKGLLYVSLGLVTCKIASEGVKVLVESDVIIAISTLCLIRDRDET